jgi:TolB-like protein/Flp pilus assembly protein TadD
VQRRRHGGPERKFEFPPGETRLVANLFGMQEHAGNSRRARAMDEAGQPGTPLSTPAPEQLRRVFVSYASHDAAVAQKVCGALETAGYSCWIAPRNVVPGSMYADGIVHAIDESSVLVLILSGHAIASTHVGREIERAVSKRHPVLALRIDTAPLSAAFEYFLNQSQWIEGGGSDAAIAQLVGAAGQHLAPGNSTSQTNGPEASAIRRAVTPPVWIIAAAVVAVLLAGGYFLVDKAWRSKHGTPTSTAVVSDKSIAVLPFTDMSEKKDQEYFSDGLSEELIDMLTKVPELRVPARTSSFYFKGKQATIAEIAKALGVVHVLEGSVRKSGNTLRITAQLIRVDNGYHVWSETFDRQLGDIFEIQDEIAGAVVKALKVSLLKGEAPRAAPTANTQAYTLYLQARSIAGRAAATDSAAAVDYLQQSVKLDPAFAAAWAAMAGILVDEAAWHGVSPGSREQAYLAAQRSLSLDPTLSDGHLAMAKILDFFDRDPKAAETEYRRALKLDPGNDTAVRWYAYLNFQYFRFDQALQLAQSAVSYDPLNAWNFHLLGWALAANGRLAEAKSAYRKALELNPTGAGLHALFASVLLLNGEAEAALAETERETDDLFKQGAMPFVLDALGRTGEANMEIKKLETKYGALRPISIADFYACRNDADRAIEWLGRGFRENNTQYLYGFPSCLKNLKADPRYKALLQKMNLPEKWGS